MPTFTNRTVDSVYNAEASVSNMSKDDALSAGVRGAIMIAADEIRDGKASSVVEVILEDERGKRALRSTVMVSVASLAVSSVPEQAPLTAVTDVQ